MRKRTLALCLGMIVSLLLLELLIRVGGAWHRYRQARNQGEPLAADLRIVTVGESTSVYPTESSYPIQLQGMLQAALPTMRVEVFNCGVAGSNSSILSSRLQAAVERFRPHVVLMMMGASDNGTDVPFTGADDLPSKHLLGASRVYRLPRYLNTFRITPTPGVQPSAAEPPPPPSASPDPLDARPVSPTYATIQQIRASQPLRVLELAPKAMAEDPSDLRVYVDYAEAANIANQKRDEAKAALRRAIARWPQEASLYVGLAVAHRDVEPGRKEWLQAAVGHDYEHLARSTLAAIFVRHLTEVGLDSEAERFFDCMSRTGRLLVFHALARGYWLTRQQPAKAARYEAVAAQARRRPLLEVTQRSYAYFAQMAQRYGFRLVSVQYATLEPEPLQSFFAEHPEVLVIDNREPFNTRIAAGGYRDLFVDNCYASFGHATALGNQLLARNIADALLRARVGDLARPAQVVATPGKGPGAVP